MGNTRLNVVTRPGDGCQCRGVAGFVGVAPGDYSMFRQNDECCVRFGTYRQRNLASQSEAGAAIGNPDQVITEAFSRWLLAICGAGEVVRGVGMRVIDVRKWEKPMQECLDGGTRAGRLVEAVREIVN